MFCRYCGNPTSNKRCAITCTDQEAAAIRDGRRVASLSQDGIGERDLTPDTSPIEAAYRRGFQQALAVAAQVPRDAWPELLRLAEHFRYDGEVHNAYSDEILSAAAGIS